MPDSLLPPQRPLAEAYRQADLQAAIAFREVKRDAPELTNQVLLRAAHDYYFRPELAQRLADHAR